MVYLVVANHALRDALVRSLRELGPIIADGAFPAAIASRRHAVVSTSVDMSPDDCRHLAARGVVIVILATLPGPVQESIYRHAGVAAYVPMGMASDSLADRLRPLISQREPC